jgi:alkylhydroperoxidase family enzyme
MGTNKDGGNIMIRAATLAALVFVGTISAVVAADQPPSRVPLIGDQTKDPAVQEVFANVRKRGSEPLNLQRTTANAPGMMKGTFAMAYAIRYGATVPRPYREIAIIRATQLNGGHYEEAQHRPMAMSCGLSRAQLDAIADWKSSKLFDDKQRAVLGWTDGVVQKPGPTDAEFATMKKYFSDREIVELTLTATTYAGMSMFTRAMRTPLDLDAGDENNAYGKC